MTPTDILSYAALIALVGLLWLCAYLCLLPLTLPDPHQGEGERGTAGVASSHIEPDPADSTGLPPGTLIEIGDAAFTPDEASKIVSLREYYAGKKVSLPWRVEGSGNGGDAA